MDAEINNVIYMELNSGPKIANSACGKTIDVETIDRDSTVFATGSISVLKSSCALTQWLKEFFLMYQSLGFPPSSPKD